MASDQTKYGDDEPQTEGSNEKEHATPLVEDETQAEPTELDEQEDKGGVTDPEAESSADEPDGGVPVAEAHDASTTPESPAPELTDSVSQLHAAPTPATKKPFWSLLRHHWKIEALIFIAILIVAGGAFAFVRSRSGTTVPKSRFAAVAVPFKIVSTVPASGQDDVVDASKIVLNFSRPVDASKLNGDFFVSPVADGTYSQGANPEQAIFTPKVPFAQATSVKVMVHGEYESEDGSKLGADYSFGFTTATPDNGVAFERSGFIEKLGSVQAGTKQSYSIMAGDSVKTGNTVTIYTGSVQQLLTSLTYADQQSPEGYTYPDFAQATVDTAGLSTATTKTSLKDGDTFDFTPAKGVYLLVDTNNGIQAGYSWLVASDFGIVLRQDDQQVVFLAEDLATGSATTADLTLYNLHNSVQQLDELSIDGMAAKQLPFKPSLDIVVAKHGDDVAVVPVSTYLTLADIRVQKDLSTSDTIYGLTDRPTYNPGDTVNYAAFVRTDNDAAYQIPDSGSLQLYVAAYPGGTHYADATAPISAGGVVHAAFTIGAGAIPDGQTSQQLYVYNGSANNPTDADSPAGAFTVTSTKPSVWRIGVSFAKSDYLASDTIAATVTGTDSSGASLAGKKVAVTIYNKNYYEGDAADNLSSFGTYGSAINDQPITLTLDSSGHATVPIDVSKFPAGSSQVATVQASATDPNGITAGGGASAVVHEGNGTLTFGPSRTVVTSGGQIVGRVYVHALDGSPLSNTTVAYQLSMYQGDTPKQLTSGSTTTDSNGFAEIDLAAGNYPAGTSLTLTASTSDTSGNRISAANYYYVQGADDNIAHSDVQLADLDIYGASDDAQVGQTLALTVDAPQAINALVTTERGRIHSYKLVNLKQGKNSFPLQVSADLAPSFSLIFSYFQGGTYYTEGVTFNVTPSDKQAAVQLTAPAMVQAGHTSAVSVKVSGKSGQPLSSSVIFGAVSANVYDLNNQVTPNIFDYLYSTRDITTNASSSLTGIGSGGGKCGGGGFDQPALLNPLGTTALWQPALTTDATGTATVQLQLAKGTWRVYAYAIGGDDSSVGSSFTTITAQ